MDDLIFSSKEAAKLLDVSERRVRQLVQRGQLQAKMVAGTYIIDAAAIAKFSKTRNLKRGRPRKEGR